MARILIVDDDQDAASLFRRRLEKLGHEVVDSATGEGALRALDQTMFDLVLLDLFLPGISGYEVARRMAEDDRLCGVPVIMISISEKDDGRDAPNIKGWLLKPFRGSDLEAMIVRHVGGGHPDGEA